MSFEEEQELAKFTVLLEKLRLSQLDQQDDFQDYFLAIQTMLSEIKSLKPSEFSILKQKYVQELEEITQQIELIQANQFDKLSMNIKRYHLESIQANQMAAKQQNIENDFNSAHFYPVNTQAFFSRIFNVKKADKKEKQVSKEQDVVSDAVQKEFDINLSKNVSAIESPVIPSENNKTPQSVESPLQKKLTLKTEKVTSTTKSKKSKIKKSQKKKNKLFQLNHLKNILKPKNKNELMTLNQKESAKVFVKEIDVDSVKKSQYQSFNVPKKNQEDAE